MPQVNASIRTIDDLRSRAQTAARQAAEVSQLADLPFGGIDPRNVMTEFNELLSAAVRLLGREQSRDFHAYSPIAQGQVQAGSPLCRRLVLREAVSALQRLASHLGTQTSMEAAAVIHAK